MCLSVDPETDTSLLPFLTNVLLQLQKHILLTFDQGWLPWVMESSLYVFKNAVEVGYVHLCFQISRNIHFSRRCLSSHKTHSLEEIFCGRFFSVVVR